MGEKFACGALVVLPPSTPECAGKQQVQQEFSWHPCGNKPLLTQRQTNRSSECIHFARDAFMFFLPSDDSRGGIENTPRAKGGAMHVQA